MSMPASRLSKQRAAILSVKGLRFHNNRCLKAIASAMCGLFLAACAGTAQTDWQTRIGRDSLSDVTRELGRPESCIGLDDGGTACSWLTAKDRERVEKLILTFGTNGKLATSNHVQF